MDRRASSLSLVGLALGAIAVAGACGAVPDLHFADDDGGPGVEGGLDAKRDVDPNCKKTGPEICDDGIDNDCNGDVDCQDAACTPTFSCQDAPAGWTAVGFAAEARPGCPTGTAPTDLQAVSGDGSASCTCTCGAAGASCGGNLTLTLTTENTCAVSPTIASVPVNGNCTQLPSNVNLPTGAFGRTAPASCAPIAAVKGGALTSGRLCQAARFGGGCGPGQLCAPKPTTAGLDACVAKIGSQACPAGFGRRSTAGLTGTDARTCTGCACAAAVCSGGIISVYDNNMCKTVGGRRGATGITETCAATNDSGFTATHFTSTAATGNCGTPTSQAAPGGALTLTDQRTLCCK